MEPEILQAIEDLCGRLAQRRAALFLGAGINYGLVDSDGVRCPLGQDLSRMIGRDLLDIDASERPLDSIAEMARYRVGEKELNSYLHNLFKSYTPGTQHLSLVQLPWNVIYTTNYDTLVEQAAATKTITPAGVIRRVVSTNESVDDFKEEDIPYYKLHGCIDVANTRAGRLILTKEDYRYYERFRKPLFRRLREDLIHQTLVFIGYGLEDDNFREILEDCREELKSTTFPNSYAIRVGATDIDKGFWREKYNITTLNIPAQDFLNLLKGTWNSQNCSVIPFNLRHTNEYTKFDDNTSFQKIGESFYLVKASDCNPAANPEAFFKGKEASWGDIISEVPPARDTYFALYDSMLEELVDLTLTGNEYLVTGSAGTGKTTLIRMLAYDFAKSSLPVIIHIPGTPLDPHVLGPLFNVEDPKRVVIIIEHASERIEELERFIIDIRRKKLPVSVILTERKNLWEFAKVRLRQNLSFAEYELGRLSIDEIYSILGALNKHNMLGKLTGMSKDYQIEHFEKLAHKELLVALRELTETGSFDEIIRDEYQKIPSNVAKDAYRYTAALGQIDQPIRLEILARLLDINIADLGDEVMKATEGVLLSGEDFGLSRHNSGFRVQSRHPVIASVVFEYSAPEDQSKYEIIISIIDHLNPSFPEDLRVLENIVKRKELVNTIASKPLRRSIFERIETALPNNPFVLQHRSLLEREMGDADAAIRFAQAAVDLNPQNITFMNTLGFAYEAKAKDAQPLESMGMLLKATKIFEDGIKEYPSNPYSYLGLYNVMRQRERNLSSSQDKMKHHVETLSMLEDAYESTGQSHLISVPLAATKETLGKPEEAIDFLKEELKKQPHDARLRDLLVRMLQDIGENEDALKIAEDGAKYNPAAWRLQRHIARLQVILGRSVDSIIGHYASAFRHNKSDTYLIAEYGAFLFKNAKYSEAENIFNKGRQLPGRDNTKIREYWKDNQDRDRVFVGYVSSITAANGHVMAVPENFTALFWRTKEPELSLKQRQDITFTIAFTACGAVARTIQTRK